MNKQEQQIKELLKGSFSNEELSDDFTQNIMSKIELIESKPSFQYTPVISVKAWFGIVAMLIGVVFLSSLNIGSSATFFTFQLPEMNFKMFSSPVLALSVCAIFFLLVIERLLNNRKQFLS